MKILKITIKSQLKHLKLTFLVFIALCFWFFIDYYYKQGIGIYLIGYAIITILPVWLIHTQYLIKNLGVRLIPISIDSFYYVQNGHDKTIEYEDILKVEKIICSTSHEFYNITADYFYHQITLQNGEKIILTCLLAEELPIKVEDIIEKKRFYPFIK